MRPSSRGCACSWIAPSGWFDASDRRPPVGTLFDRGLGTHRVHRDFSGGSRYRRKSIRGGDRFFRDDDLRVTSRRTSGEACPANAWEGRFLTRKTLVPLQRRRQAASWRRRGSEQAEVLPGARSHGLVELHEFDVFQLQPRPRSRRIRAATTRSASAPPSHVRCRSRACARGQGEDGRGGEAGRVCRIRTRALRPGLHVVVAALGGSRSSEPAVPPIEKRQWPPSSSNPPADPARRVSAGRPRSPLLFPAERGDGPAGSCHDLQLSGVAGDEEDRSSGASCAGWANRSRRAALRGRRTCQLWRMARVDTAGSARRAAEGHVCRVRDLRCGSESSFLQGEGMGPWSTV